MAIFSEREPKNKTTEGITEIPDTVSLPKDIERKEGVKSTPSQVTSQVTHQRKPIIQTQQTKKVSIKLPADESQLTAWSKGKVGDSATWLGSFWLRMIKKAKHFGWSIVRGDK